MNISAYSAPVAFPAPASAVAPAARPAQAGVAAPAAPAPDASNSEPAAPVGSDPALWSVLTSEERDFFARQSAMGPVTYGPGRTHTASPPTGQRIDVRA